MRAALRWTLPVVGALVVSPVGAVAQDAAGSLAGTWAGTLDTGAARLTIVFHVERADDGTLRGSMDSPDQGATGIPLSGVSIEGRAVRLDVAVAGGGFSGTLAEGGDAIRGTWTQGPASLPLELARSAAAPAPARPQEPKPPLPYTTVEVTFPNPAAGIELAGTLTLPALDAYPGVVLVSGSGPQDRDETVMGHRPFLVLADHLTRNGIAVLRFDDRGVGRSGGDFATATSEDFASDALAALAFLRSGGPIPITFAGIAGHSEGGLIAPMAASRSADVSFVVMLAGPGVPGRDIILAQGERIGRAAGTPQPVLDFNGRIQSGLADVVAREPDTARAATLMRALIDEEVAAAPPALRQQLGQAFGPDAAAQAVAQFNTPWFRYFLGHDPRPDLERVRVPVLALIGEKDMQVPADQNVGEIRAALQRGGNRDATVRVLPGLNHLFQTATTGVPSEYAMIEETMSPIALEAVTRWILERAPAR